jgi:hypothetical protein
MIDYITYVIPALMAGVFIGTSLWLRNAEGKLDGEFFKKNIEIKRQFAKKMLPFLLFLPLFIVSKSMIEKYINIYFISVFFIVVVFTFMVKLFLDKLKTFQKEGFPDSFISIYKKTEILKIGSFALILLLLFAMVNFS